MPAAVNYKQKLKNKDLDSFFHEPKKDNPEESET